MKTKRFITRATVVITTSALAVITFASAAAASTGTDICIPSRWMW